MKILILFIFSLSTAFLARAQEGNSAAVEVIQEENTFHIKYLTSNQKKRAIVISIYNEQNKLSFSESITSQGSFTRPYNFSELADGIYIIKITDEQQVIIHPFQYKAAKAESAAQKAAQLKKEVLLRVSQVEGEKNKFKVSIYSSNDYELVLRIYDNNQNTLFEGEAAPNTSRVFDLGKAPSGRFYFQVLDANYSLIHEVIL